MSDRLREVLRRGDPAGEETGLSPAEVQAMRRAVLSAAPEPRRTFRLAPAFAAGAVAVLSLVVALSLWRLHGSVTVPPIPPAPAPASTPPPVSQSPVAVAVVSPPPPAPLAQTPRRREPERRPRLAETTAKPADPRPGPAPEPEDPPVRQVQFSAPGGTRIIWLLPESRRPTDPTTR